MKKHISIDIEYIKENRDIEFYVKQFDDVVLSMRIFDGLSPVLLGDSAISIGVDKPDGTKVLQKEGITANEGVITVDLSPYAVMADGECKMEVLLEGDNGISTTSTFRFIVEKAINAEITDIIVKSDDIHHLKVIEAFIAEADIDIVEINDSLDLIKNRIIEIEAELELNYGTALENINNASVDAVNKVLNQESLSINVVKEAENSAVSGIQATKEEVLSVANEAVNKANEAIGKANEVIIEVGTAKGEVQELMATIEASKEEVNEMGQAQVANIMGAGTTAVLEVGTAKNSAISEINTAKDVAISGVNASKDGAILELGTVKEGAINEVKASATPIVEEAKVALHSEKELVVTGASGEMTTEKGKVVETAKTELEAIKGNIKTEAETELGTVKGNTVIEAQNAINTVKDSAIVAINDAKSGVDTKVSEANAKILEVQNEVNGMVSKLNELLQANTEAGVVATELNALIEEAKAIMVSLRSWIDSNGDNNIDLSELTSAVEKLKEDMLVIEANFDNYVPKKFVDKVGNGLYLPDLDPKYDSAPKPDFEPVHTYKYMYRTSNGYNMYNITYFKTSLVDNPNAYMYMKGDAKTGQLTFGCPSTEYVTFRAQSSNGEWLSSSASSIKMSDKTSRVYYHDFPIYDEARTKIIFDDATKSGVGDFNKATIEGDYSINLPEEDFNALYNGVKVSKMKPVLGYLNVKKIGDKILQTMYLDSHGCVYLRVLGEQWQDITSGAISKSPLNNIKVSAEGLPECLQNIPPLPMYGQETTDIVIYKVNANNYNVVRLINGATGRVFYTGSTSFYINVPQYRTYTMTYNIPTDTWETVDLSSSTVNLGSTTVVKSEFKVLYNTMPIYKESSSTSTELYQDITTPDSNELTIMDFDNAVSTGIYGIDIKTGDNILNSPLSFTTVIEEQPIEEEMDNALRQVVYRIRKEVLNESLSGMLQVFELGTDIYQKITSSDNTREWNRVRANGIWSEWQEAGGGKIDLSNYYTIEQIDEKLLEITNAIGTVKGELIENINGIIGGI